MWIVRDAGAADVAAIAAVHRDARLKAMPWLKVPHTDGQTQRWIGDTLLSTFQVRVADDGGSIIGYKAFGDGFLEALYVAPGRQGQGVGSRLLDEAKSASGPALRLHTFQRNTAARRFYEARGFRAVWFGDGSGNDEGEPDMMYEWSRPSARAPSEPFGSEVVL